MATNGSFYWNELMTRDAEAAKKFYGATLGWTFEPMEQGEGATYWVAKVGDESVAGIYTIEPDDQETGEGWFAYVAVDDLSGALARASMEGGQVVRELRGEIGTLAVQLAERIVDQRLSDDVQVRATVDSFLADLEQSDTARTR